MSRYLSPAKICLVILIDLYRANEAPPSNGINLLSFISSHILRRHADTPSSDSKPHSIRSLKDFESLLVPITSNFPGRSLYDVFLRHLWQLQSIEQLEDVFQVVRQDYLLVPVTVLLTSIGYIVRASTTDYAAACEFFQSDRTVSTPLQPGIRKTTVQRCPTAMGRFAPLQTTVSDCLGCEESRGCSKHGRSRNTFRCCLHWGGHISFSCPYRPVDKTYQ